MEDSYDPYNHQPHPHPQHAAPAGPKQAEQIGPRSVEYIFLTISLLTAAASLIIVLIIWVNGLLKDGTDFDVVALPVAALVISLPLFAALLADLKKAEIKNPVLKADFYKRRSTQVVRVTAFTACLFTLIGLVYGIFIHAGSSGSGSLTRLFVDVFIILAVAGGILAYYLKHEP